MSLVVEAQNLFVLLIMTGIIPLLSTAILALFDHGTEPSD